MSRIDASEETQQLADQTRDAREGIDGDDQMWNGVIDFDVPTFQEDLLVTYDANQVMQRMMGQKVSRNTAIQILAFIVGERTAKGFRMPADILPVSQEGVLRYIDSFSNAGIPKAAERLLSQVRASVQFRRRLSAAIDSENVRLLNEMGGRD